jgi:hypothetical protein
LFSFPNHIYLRLYDIQTVTPFAHLIPSNPFDLYWTMWNTDQTTFRGRHLLVLESLFIHQPLMIHNYFYHFVNNEHFLHIG